MELTCACILFIVGFVTASPYGYGTKGGATAKADASAVAGVVGSVGDIPASVPTGAGYSGSYSKSAASSFASSSASSSASSFSYSGSGALNFPGGNSGSIPNGSGCSSGSCQGAGKGYNPSAAGSQSYNSNAGSVGTGSSGYGSNYNANNVNGGNYGNSPSDKASDCGSGSCQPGKNSPSGIGSNSYSQANSVAGTTGSGYSASHPKTPIASDSGCSNGNCDLPVSNDKCGSGQCGDDVYKTESGDKKCISGYCDYIPQTGSGAPYYSNDNKCVSGKCESDKETSINDNDSDDISVPKSNYGSPINFNDKTSNYGSSCANGNCGPSYPKPTYSEPSPISDSTKCTTPGCNNFGQSPSSYSSATAASGYNKPSTHLTAPKEDVACTTPNCQSSNVNTRPSYNGYSPIPDAPNSVTSPAGNSPSYNGYNAPVSVTSPDASPSYIAFPPNYNPPHPVTSPGANSPCIGYACNSHAKVPLPTSTNYGSQPPISTGSGCTSPNCGNINPSTNCAGGNCGPALGPQDNKGFNSQPSYNTHYSQGNTASHSPTSPGLGCSPNSPNCGSGVGPSGYVNPAVTSSPQYTAPGFGLPSSYKPSYRPSSSPIGQPAYETIHGSPNSASPYGGAPNLPIQPSNSYSVASSGQPSTGYYKPGYTGLGSYQSGPGYTPQNTAPSVGSGLNTGSYNYPGYGTYTAPGPNVPNCNTPGCSNPTINNIASAQAGTGNLPKPADGEKHKDKPAYTGGFGGPSGVLKPNEYDVSSPTLKPVSSPIVTPSKPNCISGNCGNPSVSTSPSYSHGGANAGAEASANAVAYTGGFGGPPGFLKPYDDGKVDLPIGKQISHNGINNDDHFSNSNGGNGSFGHSGAQAHSAAQASAVAGASSGYKSGGCGGGCGGNNGGGANFGPSGSYGLTKSGYGDGSSGGLNIASASAKSIASSDGANLRGGYAGSSATAHASTGIKSSYGKR